MKLFASILSFLITAGVASAQPRTFLLDSASLTQVRAFIQQNKEPYKSTYTSLLQEAQKSLAAGPFSVVNKTVLPPSGNKHDYYSFGTYWWPDSTKPEGLPYIRKDGVVNPETESDKFDKKNLYKMIDAVETLSLTFFFSHEEKYARHARALLRVWFLQPDTRMNPHLEYAQAIPGRVDGRGIGIIETVQLKRVVDAIGLLEASQNFNKEEGQGLRGWFQSYLSWLQNSQNGKDENNWYNNHGSWYDVQVSDFALFLGQDTLARRVIAASKYRRLQTQTRPEGSQLFELERTRSLSYSLYNLTAYFNLAMLGEHIGVDLWHYRSPEGISLKAALDFLLPYYQGEVWPHEQILPIETTYKDLIPLLKQATKVYHEKQYGETLQRLPVDLATDRINLFYP